MDQPNAISTWGLARYAMYPVSIGARTPYMESRHSKPQEFTI
jgi:hypothetical protein